MYLDIDIWLTLQLAVASYIKFLCWELKCWWKFDDIDFEQYSLFNGTTNPPSKQFMDGNLCDKVYSLDNLLSAVDVFNVDIWMNIFSLISWLY